MYVLYLIRYTRFVVSIYRVTKTISWTSASWKKQLCNSYKFPLNSSFRLAFHDAHNRGQTIITSSSVTSNKYRAFCKARQELWTHNVSAECTWHDNRHTHTHTHTHTHRLTQIQILRRHTHGQKSTISLLDALRRTFLRSSSFNVVCILLSLSHQMNLNALPFLTRHSRTALETLSLRLTERSNYRPATVFWPMSARSACTIYLDPPVWSIGTALKKRSRCSIVSNHDSSPPPRARAREQRVTSSATNSRRASSGFQPKLRQPEIHSNERAWS